MTVIMSIILSSCQLYIVDAGFVLVSTKATAFELCELDAWAAEVNAHLS